MLQYLHSHSRPDITFAVSQCARYVHGTRRSHEIALEHLGQYLKGTMEKGLVLRPTSTLNIDCFVDADFAGLWPYEDRQDPSCVKSRTGFVICLADCPVIWSSKLQGEIATSTMEAEYSALSSSMRSLLPFQHLVHTVIKSMDFGTVDSTTFKTTVWEDNAGALALANLEPGRMTPRSKHYAIKYHWFRSKLKPTILQVEKIDTNLPESRYPNQGTPNRQVCRNSKIIMRLVKTFKKTIYLFLHIYIFLWALSCVMDLRSRGSEKAIRLNFNIKRLNHYKHLLICC